MPFEGGAQPQLTSDPTGAASTAADIDLEPDLDEDEDEGLIEGPEPTSEPLAAQPVETQIGPPASAPTYALDPFVSTEVPSAPVAPPSENSPPSSAPTTPPEQDRAPEPRDPSDSST